MGKWLNGARVRKREIDGKDTMIAALAAENASATKKTRCFRGAFRKIRRQALKQVPSHTQRGYQCTASSNFSHAEGFGCTAQGRNQHIQGKYNIASGTSNSIVDSDYAHIVGNGTSDSKRSNTHTLTCSGVPWYQGRPQFGGTAMDNGSQTVMANGDKKSFSHLLQPTALRNSASPQTTVELSPQQRQINLTP